MRVILLAFAVAWGPTAVLACDAPETLTFDVYRNDGRKPFGLHEITFACAPDGALQTATVAELKVKIGPIPVFKYRTEGEGLWRDGVLVRYVSETDDNGDEKALDLKYVDGRYRINGALRNDLTTPLLPATHWNPAIIRADRLIDAQDGDVFPVSVSSKGRGGFTIADRTVEAERIHVEGQFPYDLYFEGERLVGAQFFLRGNTLSYVPAGDDAST